jgi:hypothetical protein
VPFDRRQNQTQDSLLREIDLCNYISDEFIFLRIKAAFVLVKHTPFYSVQELFQILHQYGRRRQKSKRGNRQLQRTNYLNKGN